MRLSRPPPLRTLRAFCVAARQLSFKLAADELCLTPSAVSHQMKELETILGMRLFVRRTRALELTAAGLRLLEEVEPLLEGLDRALAQLARGDGRETLRVRAPALFASELLIPRLEEFCEAHPSIDVQLDTRDPRPVQTKRIASMADRYSRAAVLAQRPACQGLHGRALGVPRPADEVVSLGRRELHTKHADQRTRAHP